MPSIKRNSPSVVSRSAAIYLTRKGSVFFLNYCPLNVESSREASSGISRFFIIICAVAVCAAAFFLYCDAFFETVTFLFYISFKNILYFAFF